MVFAFPDQRRIILPPKGSTVSSASSMQTDSRRHDDLLAEMQILRGQITSPMAPSVRTN